MGDPRRKNDDGFEQEALSVLQGGNDDGFDQEAAGVLAPKTTPATAQPRSMFTEPDPSMKAPDARGVLEQLVDPSGAWTQGLADGKTPGEIDTEANGGVPFYERAAQAVVNSTPIGEGLGAMGRYVANVGQGALAGGLQHYRDDPDHSILEALIAAKDAGLASAALGATGATTAGAGGILGKGAARARQAAFGATKDDLNALGVTPEEFAQRTDELGLNNTLRPMDPADKRARIQEVLADRGAKHDAAIAAADAQNPLAGRDVNGEIARDIEQNADRVWTGRSNQREGIVNAMGKTANAVEQGDPIDSLAELARYRTQQGGQAFGKFGTLPEAASGRGALAAYDSADQLLHEGMRASGDANYQLFTSADNDFHDAKLLEELTQQGPPSNPWRRPIGAAVGAAVGMAAGGPIGAGIGAGVADLTRGYQPDMAANLMKLGAGGLQGAGNAMQAAAPAAGSMQEQLTQVQGQSRGQMQPQIVESLLDSNPQALGPYAQPLMQARKDGTLNQKLTQLRNIDDVWQRQFLPQLMQMSAQAP